MSVQAGENKQWTGTDVAQHASKDSLWVIVKGMVYDLTGSSDPGPTIRSDSAQSSRLRLVQRWCGDR